MKKAIVQLCAVMFATLTALAEPTVTDYKLWWVDAGANKPGCCMAFRNEVTTWNNWMIQSGVWYGNPCTVYRDGVAIAAMTTKDPTFFTDYDVIPGETYSYEIHSTAGYSSTGYREAVISKDITCKYIYGADMSTRELAFGADSSDLEKKLVTISLYMQTVDTKTGVTFGGVSYMCSDNWIKAEVVTEGIKIWVSSNDTESDRKGTVTVAYDGFMWPIKVTQAGKTTKSYSTWAAANGLSGEWDAKDANGIHNVFRYVFGKPTGKFTDKSLINITFEGGKPVIKTPIVVNSSGFTLSVAASDRADGTGNVSIYTLNASGETMINEESKQSRFFRLKVDLAQ